MRVIMTLNMQPKDNRENRDIHQITVEYPAANIHDFCRVLNDHAFIVVKLIYRQPGERGETLFIDRGELIVNTQYIGKVVEYHTAAEVDYKRNNYRG